MFVLIKVLIYLHRILQCLVILKDTKLWKFYLLLLHKNDVYLWNSVDFTALYFKWHNVTDRWWIIYLKKGLCNLWCTKKNVHACMTICTQKSEAICHIPIHLYYWQISSIFYFDNLNRQVRMVKRSRTKYSFY